MRHSPAGLALVVALAWAIPAAASVSADVLKRTRGAQDPDWPCQQIKVPELSPAAVWAGPPIDDALTRWRADNEIEELVGKLAPRRMPVEDASAAIADFAKGLSADAKTDKLTLLFAGLFATLNGERTEVMAGIDRYGRKQKGLAEQIRAEQSRLSDLNSSSSDPQQASALNDQLVWETRVFNDRRGALSSVCEVPTLIEQRVFALGRAIEKELKAKSP
jgi:hypothetical protein